MKALRYIQDLSHRINSKPALEIKDASLHTEKIALLKEVYYQHKFLSVYILHAKEHVQDAGFLLTLKKYYHTVTTQLFDFHYAITMHPADAESFVISQTHFKVISRSVNSGLNKLPHGWKTDLYFSRFILKMLNYNEELFKSLLKFITPFKYKQINYVVEEMSNTIHAMKTEMKLYSDKIIHLHAA